MYEVVEDAHHPFGHKTEPRHNIVLHIQGAPLGGIDKGNENIWFLIMSIHEAKNKNINDIKTGHDTKKMYYDAETKSLNIVGHKYRDSDPQLSQGLKMLTSDEISQQITPRTIVIKEKDEVQYSTDVQIDKTLKSNATEKFYAKLQELYAGTVVQLNLRRFRADRSRPAFNNPKFDNFPTYGSVMQVYLDLRQASQSQPSSLNTKNLSHDHNNTEKSSFFTFNKIMIAGFISLSAVLLHHFFCKQPSV